MAPESMAARSYSFASDVYALSLLVYELARRQVRKRGKERRAPLLVFYVVLLCVSSFVCVCCF
jgi:serine/threonine protein kinase